jgi:hypothetical protein
MMASSAVDVDAEDVLARHHDVVDGDFLQVQDVQQHVLVAWRDHQSRFTDDRAQFLRTQHFVRTPLGIDAEHPQQAVADRVDGPHGRIQRIPQHVQHVGCWKGEAFRVQRGERLGSHLADDQYCHRDHSGGDRDSRVTPQADRDHGADHRSEDVHEVVADQDQADQPVWTFQQVCRDACTALRLAQMPQPVTIERHHAGFGTGEERRHQQAGNQDAEQQLQRDVVQERGGLVYAGLVW